MLNSPDSHDAERSDVTRSRQYLVNFLNGLRSLTTARVMLIQKQMVFSIRPNQKTSARSEILQFSSSTTFCAYDVSTTSAKSTLSSSTPA